MDILCRKWIVYSYFVVKVDVKAQQMNAKTLFNTRKGTLNFKVKLAKNKGNLLQILNSFALLINI